MRLLRRSTIYRVSALGILGIALFVFVGLFAMSIAMLHHHDMDHCPYSVDVSAFCGMTADEHRTIWESLSLGVTKRIVDIFVTILGIVAWLFFLYKRYAQETSPPLCVIRLKNVNLRQSGFCLFPELFSQGILHSKAW